MTNIFYSHIKVVNESVGGNLDAARTHTMPQVIFR